MQLLALLASLRQLVVSPDENLTQAYAEFMNIIDFSEPIEYNSYTYVVVKSIYYAFYARNRARSNKYVSTPESLNDLSIAVTENEMLMTTTTKSELNKELYAKMSYFIAQACDSELTFVGISDLAFITLVGMIFQQMNNYFLHHRALLQARQDYFREVIDHSKWLHQQLDAQKVEHGSLDEWLTAHLNSVAQRNFNNECVETEREELDRLVGTCVQIKTISSNIYTLLYHSIAKINAQTDRFLAAKTPIYKEKTAKLREIDEKFNDARIKLIESISQFSPDARDLLVS